MESCQDKLSPNLKNFEGRKSGLSPNEIRFLNYLRSSKKPKIRISFYKPNEQIGCEFNVPSCNDPRLRKPNSSSENLSVPTKPRRLPALSQSTSTSPSSSMSSLSPHMQSFSEGLNYKIPRHLPQLTNYRKNVIKKLKRFNAYVPE